MATSCLLVVGAMVGVPATAGAAAVAHRGPPAGARPLDLGPVGLTETRVTTTVTRGVTLTKITRGIDDPALMWTLEVLIGPAPGSPDPDAPPTVLSTATGANAAADRLRSKGFAPRVESVQQPRAVDVPKGTLGFRVRVGRWPTKADVDRAQAALLAAGERANSVFTGWDGDRSARGPWHVNVVTIDPKAFRGRLGATFGPDLLNRETTSALSGAAGASVGINAGFFVLDPASGAPGDPAGVGVYNGRLISEPIAGRPALVLHDDASHTAVQRLSWKGTAHMGGRSVSLDGVDRVPGLIRNCGGDASDIPTSKPLHDITCTDPDEVVELTTAFGARTPSGPGREVVLGRDHRVSALRDNRGVTLTPGEESLQATGERVRELDGIRLGDRIGVSAGLRDSSDHLVRTSAADTIVNGGPQLMRNGLEEITQARDGFVHPGDPSFGYGFVVKRNPRTLAGVDQQGRTVLVTVDGRSVSDLGLSIPETADVARSLGLVDAINLDGGGSTAMAVDGALITHPSDPTGERPVGDAIVVTPGR
ncbi:phosphodiester glycosidase family protein [Lapillicoccus sp.]|uniref:phosphodiester glycosidase family protein n=1 Tax=Lapillicoccus sp. TaxID=1909287 RepID=UPI003983AA74